MMHDLTKEEWGRLFTAAYFREADLDPNWEVHQKLVEFDLECWIDDGNWQWETPEDAVVETLSCWD